MVSFQLGDLYFTTRLFENVDILIILFDMKKLSRDASRYLMILNV